MKKLYYLSFGLLFLTTVCFAEISKKEKKALVDLYTTTNGKHWVKKWDLNTPVSQWHGVTIENNKVVGINLFHNNLMGPISSEIGKLEHLKVLNLAFNSLTGALPIEIVNLSNLKVLKLEMNRLTGALPNEIGNLNQLVELSAFNNFLTGKIPATVGNLKELKVLNLSSNDFYGDIPASLGQLAQLASLEVFQIQNNNFSSFKALEFLETKEYLVFDYDKDDRKLEFKDINFKKTRMAETKFEDIEE